MPEFTPYQKKVIDRYYDQRDEIMLTRLGEIVTDLFLAESDAKQKRLWIRAESALKALKVSPTLIGHILERKKPELLAEHLRDWLSSVQSSRSTPKTPKP